jgi:DNA-directed RNA polymerase II subunit RPB1
MKKKIEKRTLTSEEKEYILGDLSKYSVNNEYHSILTKIRIGLKKQLDNIQVYPNIIENLKDEIETQFRKSISPPGACVGVDAAMSVGERQTQLTLNTFHSAGLSVQAVVTGVPRFSEILNATKNPKSVISQLYFKKSYNSIKEIRKAVNNSLVELHISDLVLDYKRCKNKNESWYESFKLLYSDEFSNYEYCLSYTLNPEMLFKYSLSIQQIADKIEENYDDLYCVFSTNDIGKLDIYVDTSQITLPEDKILFIDQENAPDIYLEEVVKPTLDNFIICGIEGITNMFFKKIPQTTNWMVETSGTNMVELLTHPLIDSDNLVCNNVWDIYEIFGIEAARELLIEEFMFVVSSDGTYINKRHIMLLADIMTFSGTITSISRYGMRNDQSGPLAKASFEESLDNFLKAGVFGEIESTAGVSASIMCGKPSKIGSGLCDLYLNPDTLLENLKVLKRESPEEELDIEGEGLYENLDDGFDFEDLDRKMIGVSF